MCRLSFFIKSQKSNGKVVVSKLNVSPNEAPITNPTGNEYWILNNYGSNILFNGLTSVSLLTASNVSSSSPSDFTIYKRASNGHLQSSWSQDATATFINTNTINFPGTSLNQSLQWYVGSSIPLGTNEVLPKSNLLVYPNPYIQSSNLKVEGLDTIFKFTLFDINGKLIFEREVSTQVIDFYSIVSKGIYFYRIETENKLYNGKLIVE